MGYTKKTPPLGETLLLDRGKGAKRSERPFGKREQILKIAERLFARHGFSATTTREIARLARVNPALAFYYFGDKENLYSTVFERVWLSSGWEERRRQSFGKGLPDEIFVVHLANDILNQLAQNDTMLRLSLFAGLEGGPQSRHLSKRFFQTYTRKSYELLATYVRKRVREGAFRKVDPLIAARGFYGLIVYQYVIHEFLGGKYSLRTSQRQISRVLADLWLQGMLKPLPMRAGKKKTRATEDGSKRHPQTN